TLRQSQGQQLVEEEEDRDGNDKADKDVDQKGTAAEGTCRKGEEQRGTGDETRAEIDATDQRGQTERHDADCQPIGLDHLRAIARTRRAPEMPYGKKREKASHQIGSGIRIEPVSGPEIHAEGVVS